MKYKLLLITVLLSLHSVAQETFVVTGNDHYFEPDTIYTNVGDTIRLFSNGYHSITELDSLDWVNNTATDNGGFWVGVGSSISDDWFVVSQEGKYYFNCNPHATMGMKGVIYVSAALGTENTVSSLHLLIILVY